MKSFIRLIKLFSLIALPYLSFCQFGAHTITTNSASTISGTIDAGTFTPNFTATTLAATSGYAANNVPTASLSNGSGAGYTGMTLRYSGDGVCQLTGCNQQGDSGSDVIEVTYAVTNIDANYDPQIRISQRLDGTTGNDEASTWTFTWSGGGTATWSDSATAESSLYRFVYDATNNHTLNNGEDIGTPANFQANWNTSYREIDGASTTGTITSGQSITVYATNNNKTKWYIDFPKGVSSVTVNKTVNNPSGGGPRAGIHTRYPALGYGDASSASPQGGCSSTYNDPDFCDGLTRIFNGGASYNEWVSFGTAFFQKLPVELVNFKVENKDKDAFVNWETATEVDNELFVIERSLNGIDFVKVGSVHGHGNSLQTQRYNFLDKNALLNNEQLYYRLKQIDFDGNYTYSPIRSILGNTISKKLFYPNPTKDGILYCSDCQSNDFGVIEIYNVLGRKILQFDSNVQSIDLSAEKIGIYIVKVKDSNDKTMAIEKVYKF